MKTKKIIISLGIIGIVAAAVIGGTIAYFNDTETSTGNIMVAGSIDLKVDHVKQTYNDVDCKTCSVEIKSDTTNQVVSTDGGDDPVAFPHAAVVVSSPHPAWTVTGDIPGATWIWATDPTTVHDSGNVDVYYTFQKTFEWWGPVTGATLSLGVGTDNGYQVKLNGSIVGTDWSEKNYLSPADTYSGFGGFILQGTNTLEIQVKNQKMSGGTPSSNPAGLLYELVIDGNCGDDYFKSNCTLWGEKDLAPGDHFFMFNDVKPGDRGRNVISLRVNDNDAYVCLIVHDDDDQENGLVDPEIEAGDQPGVGNELGFGELSDYLDIFVWEDLNSNGLYEPLIEDNLYEGSIQTELVQMSLTGGGPTEFIGLAWCAGDIVVDHNTGDISCDGNGMLDDAQTDSFEANLTLYAEQVRNNPSFDCANVVLQ